MPKVFRTEGDMVNFDPDKIFKSILKETGMNEEDAKHITELVVRRIISSGIKFLSGPHIREIVCSILSENHFDKERKIYTRIGMPLMDYEDILEKGPEGKTEVLINPEKIHHWAANQLAEEYTLLRILSDEESKAHLYGDIYIHQLKYFDSRPYEQNWDPRIILKYGLPPLKEWNLSNKIGPPLSLNEATVQLANWLGIMQTELCGYQNLDFLNIFLAPYAKGLSIEEIKRDIKYLIHQISYFAIMTSKNTLKASLFCLPKPLKEFLEIPAVGANGTYKGVYGDYITECLNIFTALSEIFIEGDYNRKKFEFPKQIIVYDEDFLDDYESIYIKLFDEIKFSHTPHFVNLYSNWFKNKVNNVVSNSYTNYGILQKISLNLPRYAYMGKTEENFMQILSEKVKLCFDILDKKYKIIKKRLETKHLPMLSRFIEKQPLFELENQKLCIGFVGLNEAVKILIKSELHESSETFNFGKKIVLNIKGLCEEEKTNSGKEYNLIEDSSKKPITRFIRLDLNHFPKETTHYLTQEKHYYTNSAHFSDNSHLKLEEHLLKQGEFQSIIQNGVLDIVSLSKYNLETKDLKNILRFVAKNTKLFCLKFIS
ncbi:MAG: anaerobic ribonucleoside-triphosphate reductase [Candidatus Hodarchaeota archaeon]